MRETKKVIFKNDAPFSEFTCEINNTQIDYAKDLDVAMPMYNLIEYSDNYSKILGNLWQHYRDEPAAPIENPESSKSKIRITEKVTVDSNIEKCLNSSTLKIFM